MKDYLALTKPRITWLILMSTAIGFYFGAEPGWRFLVLLHTIIGTGLLASGTAALNQWFERDADARMRRTQARPLPAGRLKPARAFWFGVLISVLGFFDLWLGANLLTALLGVFTLLTYLFVYTPLKQRSPHSTTVGAIPGAMPPLIGFAAAHGSLTLEAWLLFGILFLWQFPHFYAIAWMYREDYERAGIRMLPVVEPDGESTARQMLLYACALLGVSLIPRWTGMTGNWYLLGAFALGLYFLYAAAKITRDRTRQRARRVLLASVIYLPLLYALMVIRPGGMKRLFIPLLLLVLAAACRRPGKEFPDYGVVPPFQLVAQDGVFDSARLAGKIWVADFFFTNCGSVCPRMTSQMHQIQQAVYRMPEVRLVSFTVDPGRDTPAVLAEYAKEHHVSPGRWFLLTGSQPVLETLDKDAFKLGDIDGNLIHSTRFVLVDGSSHIRGYYDTSEPDSIPTLIADIHALARRQS